MKKTVFVIIAVISAGVVAHAHDIKISGKVKDASGSGLLSVYVSMIKTADSSLIKAAITDDTGYFEITGDSTGSYLLRYSLLGYETKYTGPYTYSAGNNAQQEAGMVLSVSGTSQLKAVTVTAKKPLIEVKADKVVFNVENSINATGSNAMELLQKSPGITVDNNDNIIMKGKTGVRIYIDGKPSQLDTKDLASYLKSINSNDIEAIEMISSPGARYDASGNAGIINIRLKKNKKFGTNGSANINFIQGITPKGNGSVNLNYRNRKVNIFGNFGGGTGWHQNGMNFDRKQKDTSYIQESTSIYDERGINFKAGADYFMNSKNVLGIIVTTGISDNVWSNTSNTNIYTGEGSYVKNLLAYNRVPGTQTNNNINLNYKYEDTNGKSLNVDADYGLFRKRGSSTQPNYYYGSNNQLLTTIINRNFTPTDIDIYTFKADWEQKLGKGKLGLGVKTSYVVTNNTFDFYNVINNENIKVMERSNSFRYTENVNAAYANYVRILSKKVSIQAGLRMENTSSKGELTRADGRQQDDDTVIRNYTNFFPSGSVTWNINTKNSLNLTYSRRIDRPTYQDLNPFENKLDELSYQKGNAFLRPQYTHTGELTYTFMSFVNTTVGYSYVTDYATEITDTVRNASYVQQRNLATQNIISFNINSPLPIRKWWNGYVNLWYNHQFFEGMIGNNNLKAEIPSYGAYLQNTFTLGKNYTAEVSGWYNGPSVWGLTWLTKPQGGLDLGLQKQFLNKKASIKMSVTDIFFTAPWRAATDFGGLKVKGGGYWESRTCRVSFSYRFGGNQVSEARERKTGADAENSRIKGK